MSLGPRFVLGSRDFHRTGYGLFCLSRDRSLYCWTPSRATVSRAADSRAGEFRGFLSSVAACWTGFLADNQCLATTAAKTTLLDALVHAIVERFFSLEQECNFPRSTKMEIAYSVSRTCLRNTLISNFFSPMQSTCNKSSRFLFKFRPC